MTLAAAVALSVLGACDEDDGTCVRDTGRECSDLVASDADGESCQRAGCTWSEGCSNRSCTTATEQSDCEALGYCRWFGDDVANPCLKVSDPRFDCAGDAATCGASGACTFGLTCSGPPPDCGMYETVNQCTQNPLCLWREKGSPYRVGRRGKMERPRDGFAAWARGLRTPAVLDLGSCR